MRHDNNKASVKTNITASRSVWLKCRKSSIMRYRASFYRLTKSNVCHVQLTHGRWKRVHEPFDERLIFGRYSLFFFQSSTTTNAL